MNPNDYSAQPTSSAPAQHPPTLSPSIFANQDNTKDGVTPIRVGNDAQSQGWLSNSDNRSDRKRVTFCDEAPEQGNSTLDIMFGSGALQFDSILSSTSPVFRQSVPSPPSPSRLLFPAPSASASQNASDIVDTCRRCQQFASMKENLRSIERSYVREIEGLKAMVTELSADRDNALQQAERGRRATEDLRQALLVRDRELQAQRSDSLQSDDELQRMKRAYNAQTETLTREREYFFECTRFYLESSEASARREIELHDAAWRSELKYQAQATLAAQVPSSCCASHSQQRAAMAVPRVDLGRLTVSDDACSEASSTLIDEKRALSRLCSPRNPRGGSVSRGDHHAAEQQSLQRVQQPSGGNSAAHVPTEPTANGDSSVTTPGVSARKETLLAEVAAAKARVEAELRDAQQLNATVIQENEILRYNVEELHTLTEDMQNEIDDLILNEVLLREAETRAVIELDCLREREAFWETWRALDTPVASDTTSHRPSSAPPPALAPITPVPTASATGGSPTTLPPLSLDKGLMEWKKHRMHVDPLADIPSSSGNIKPAAASGNVSSLPPGWETQLKTTFQALLQPLLEELPSRFEKIEKGVAFSNTLLRSVDARVAETHAMLLDASASAPITPRSSLAEDGRVDAAARGGATSNSTRETHVGGGTAMKKDRNGHGKTTPSLDASVVAELHAKMEASLLAVGASQDMRRQHGLTGSQGSNEGHGGASTKDSTRTSSHRKSSVDVKPLSAVTSPTADEQQPRSWTEGSTRPASQLAPLALSREDINGGGNGAPLLSPVSLPTPKQVRFENCLPSFADERTSVGSPLNNNSMSGSSSRFMVPGEELFQPEEISFSGVGSHEWDLLDSDDESIPPVPDTLKRKGPFDLTSPTTRKK